MSTNQPTTASRLYTQVKKLEDDINTELTNQDNVKANMDRLDREKQAQQAIANNKENTSADIAEAKKELERIAKERKAEDKKYRDSTGILAALYTDKNQAEADLKVALNTPVVNPAHDSLVAEVNDLKATMAAMTQDIEKLEKEKEKKPRAKVGEKTEAGQAQGFLDELIHLMKAERKGGESTAGTTPTVTTVTTPAATTPRTKSLAQMPILTKASGYKEHLTKLKTFFRLNEVTTDQNKKDVLVLSLGPEVAVRVQGVDTEADPYAAMDFEEFSSGVGERMVPKASASILRSLFDSTKQKPGEYCVDYLVKKHATFVEAYPGNSMPVSFLARNLVEGLFSEELKAEMWRKISEDEEQNEETDAESISNAVTSIIQKANMALDFVRKNSGVSENTDKRGLGVVSLTDSTTGGASSSSKDKSLVLGQVEEHYGEDMTASWGTGEEGEEDVYNVEEEVDEEAPLSEEQVSYCELVEPPEQTKFWNLPEELGEAGEGGRSGGGKGACWVCGSLAHYKRNCPQRLKAVSNVVNAMLSGGRGGGQTRRPAGRWRGGRGGAARFPSAPYSAYAPFGRGAQGRPLFYPPGSRPTWFPSSPGPRPSRGYGRGNPAARNPFH